MGLGVRKGGRQGILVDLAEVESTAGDWPRDAWPLRYIALRFAPLQRELFESQGVSYHAVVSNRYELAPAQLVRWHREKAGTIEQVHRVHLGKRVRKLEGSRRRAPRYPSLLVNGSVNLPLDALRLVYPKSLGSAQDEFGRRAPRILRDLTRFREL